MKTGIGVGAVVVLIGAWVVVKSFTGAKIGEACHAGSDTDCRGWSAQCLTSKEGSFCSNECNVDKDCPTDWSCGAVGVTVIDAKGNTTKRSSDLRMCHRGVPATASATASASASASPPASVPPPPVSSPAVATATSAAKPPAAKPKPKK